MQDRISPVTGLALAAVVAVGLIVATVLFRPDLHNPADDLSFFRMKLDWRDAADVVVLGNSQVYRGFDPEAFAGQCRSVKALNFGFSGVLLRPSYVQASLPVLRANGPKVLLVGINPLQFKDEKFSDGFIDTQRHDKQFRLPWRFEAWLQPLMARLRSLEQPLPADRRVYWQYNSDGFVASDAPGMVIRPSRYQRYANDYVSRPFSKSMYDGLLSQLVAIQRDGYQVLVFSTYSSTPFELIDARMSGLDDARLAADLHRLGLAYLPVAVDGLRSYDGTHLDAPSAAEFSRRLGRVVAATTGSNVCGAGTGGR